MQPSTYMIPDSATEFVALLSDHQRLVYRVAGSYARGRADMEDLAQEIAAQAWRAFPSYDPQRRFSTWLYRIALNVAITWLRAEAPRRKRSVPYDAELHEPAVRDVPSTRTTAAASCADSSNRRARSIEPCCCSTSKNDRWPRSPRSSASPPPT